MEAHKGHFVVHQDDKASKSAAVGGNGYAALEHSWRAARWSVKSVYEIPISPAVIANEEEE
jgi:hypothetical protein